MIRLRWAISPVARDFLYRWMPTNRLLTAIRTPCGLKWGIPAIGIGVVCFLAAAILTGRFHSVHRVLGRYLVH